MSTLHYCRIDVFGSGFNAKKFSESVKVEGAKISFVEKARPLSTIPAFKLGNVGIWSTPIEHFIMKETAEKFSEYLYEEDFALRYANKYSFLGDTIDQLKKDFVEIWFVMVYKAKPEEKPCGIHYSRRFLVELCQMGASLTTEVLLEESGQG